MPCLGSASTAITADGLDAVVHIAQSADRAPLPVAFVGASGRVNTTDQGPVDARSSQLDEAFHQRCRRHHQRLRSLRFRTRRGPSHHVVEDQFSSGGANVLYLRQRGRRVSHVNNGQQVQMLCWYDYGYAEGNYPSTRWFKVGFPYSNHSGWVHLAGGEPDQRRKCGTASGWN